MKLPAPTAEDVRQLSRVMRGESVSKPGAFLQAVRAEVLARAGREDASLAQRFLERTGGANTVTIQVAADPGEKAAQEMAKSYAGDGALVRFRVERELLGGLRVFQNGTLSDVSWRSRVRRLISRVTH